MGMDEGLAAAAIRTGRQIRAALYGRVSKDPTGLQRSVDEQLGKGREVCATHDWALYEDDVFCDNDISASRFATKERPDWARLGEALAAGRYHVLVLWEVSRGDRDDLQWLTFLHMARRLGILIHITSHHHTYDVRNRRDYKTLAEEGLDSADESEKISQRILRDVEATALKGMPHGPVPYGFRREYEVNARGKRIIVGQHPDTELRSATTDDGTPVTYSRAGIVQEIVRRLLGGESNIGMAADLNSRGIPSPGNGHRRWTANTIRDIAINPAYAGLRAHNGRVVADGIWDGLISEADHYRLVGRMTDPSRKATREGGIKHLGSGIYVCGVCGAPMRPIPRPDGDGYKVSYNCSPKVLLKRSPLRDTRKVTEAELRALRKMLVREQTRTILALYDSGVTQSSICRGLGLIPSTVSQRLKAERARQGIPEPTRPPSKGYHVGRLAEPVDDYVQTAVCGRLAGADAHKLLAEDARADEKLERLLAEIAEKQDRLDKARDSHASGDGLSLEGLIRVEQTLGPEIEQARARLNHARIGPVLQGLLLPTLEEITAAWLRRSIPERREVIRALTERVEILPVRNKRRFTIEESVRIVWRGSA